MLKHEDFSACCERLFEYRPDEHLFKVNDEYINGKRKINPNVKKSTAAVGAIKIAPITKKDFDVQCEIKVVG